jgi:hypothetical protein
MPLGAHAFVSQVGDSTDTTIVRPSNWNDNHVMDGYLLAINRMTIADTSRLVLPDQTQLIVTDNNATVDHVLVGVPRTPRINQIVPTGYDHDVLGTLKLEGTRRMSVLGTGQLVLSDDFKSRQRIVLAG